jgi:hypothetical protein
MWERIFELLVAEVQRRTPGTPAAAQVAHAFDLLRVLTGLQSEPAELADDARRVLDAFAQRRAELDAVAARLGRGETARVEDWLAVACLADLAAELREKRAPLYTPILAKLPDLAPGIASLEEWLRAFPFARVLASMNAQWSEPVADFFACAVAAVCAACCAREGARAPRSLHARVAAGLDPAAPFRWAVIVAHAVQLLASLGRIDVRELSAEQCAGMALISQFQHLPGGDWG